MLHIITPLYLTEYLDKVYYSINADLDITWHISKTKKLDLPDHDFLKTDKRIKIYEVDCEESETHKKRNTVLETIKDGYFCFLDDDTIFHENMYIKYKQSEEQNLIGMLIGTQLKPDGTIRLLASEPKHLKIDTGNVLCHHSPLSVVRWPSSHIEKVNNKDSIFWTEAYQYFNKKCYLTDTPISHYNKLSNKLNFLYKPTFVLDRNGRPIKVMKQSRL
jgi:hypothetical protein